MNSFPFKNAAAALLLAMALVSCSQGPARPNPAGSKAEKLLVASGGQGTVRTALAGDVKNGPIDIDLVRVAQTEGVAAFYAYPGGEYVVQPGRVTEIYVQIWTSNPVVQNPRLIVDWGVGERDNTGCGGCRLSRTYDTEGRYRVTVTLDDRVSGTTSRSFWLNVRQQERQRSGFGTFSGTLGSGDPQFDRASASFAPPTVGSCSISGNVPNYYDTYRIFHTGGPLHIETTSALLAPLNDDDTYLHVYAGTSFTPGSACQGLVAADDDGGGGTYLSMIDADFPAGDYVVVVTSFDILANGPYTLVIR